MKTISSLAAVSLLGLALFGAGCESVTVRNGGPGSLATADYVAGELQSEEKGSFDQVWNATLKTMKEMGFTVTLQAKDTLEGRLIARTAQDKKIDIRLADIGR